MITEDDLIFSRHNLAVFCYEVSEVSVTYAGSRRHYMQDGIARAKTPSDMDRFPNMTMGHYRTFESPVELRWRSRDGTLLDTVVDLASIFTDCKILHNEPPERIYRPMPFSGGMPTIIVELIDRTVNIYLLAYIQLIANDGGLVRDEKEYRALAFSVTL